MQTNPARKNGRRRRPTHSKTEPALRDRNDVWVALRCTHPWTRYASNQAIKSNVRRRTRKSSVLLANRVREGIDSRKSVTAGAIAVERDADESSDRSTHGAVSKLEPLELSTRFVKSSPTGVVTLRIPPRPCSQVTWTWYGASFRKCATDGWYPDEGLRIAM